MRGSYRVCQNKLWKTEPRSPKVLPTLISPQNSALIFSLSAARSVSVSRVCDGYQKTACLQIGQAFHRLNPLVFVGRANQNRGGLRWAHCTAAARRSPYKVILRFALITEPRRDCPNWDLMDIFVVRIRIGNGSSPPPPPPPPVVKPSG